MKRIMAGLLLAAAIALPLSLISAPSASAGVRVGISVGYGPPPLPWYPQPICPGYGYYWVPGYWSYGPYGYFWVPGAWVWPPAVGYVWTPGWWGWYGGRYWWHRGYWGRHVGFYGGIAYGHGYDGHGYHGGRWRHGRLHYNRAVTRVKPSLLHATYNHPVKHPSHKSRRVSYHGGKGGNNLLPTSKQKRAAHENRLAPTHLQTLHRDDARRNPDLRLANNHGRPVLDRGGRTEHPQTPRALHTELAKLRGHEPSPTRKAQKPKDPVAVRTARPPVLNAKPKPVHSPQHRPVIRSKLRPTSPPRRASKKPVLNARPVHHPKHATTIKPRLRPASPPRRASKPPVLNARPQPIHHPATHQKITPRQRPTAPPRVRHPIQRQPNPVRPHRSIRPHGPVRSAPRPAPRHSHVAPRHHVAPQHGPPSHRRDGSHGPPR